MNPWCFWNRAEASFLACHTAKARFSYSTASSWSGEELLLWWSCLVCVSVSVCVSGLVAGAEDRGACLGAEMGWALINMYVLTFFTLNFSIAPHPTIFARGLWTSALLLESKSFEGKLSHHVPQCLNLEPPFLDSRHIYHSIGDRRTPNVVQRTLS